ncbi:MAG: hypothetical protein PVG25_04995, partial [Anaerolineae bacterium]
MSAQGFVRISTSRREGVRRTPGVLPTEGAKGDAQRTDKDHESFVSLQSLIRVPLGENLGDRQVDAERPQGDPGFDGIETPLEDHLNGGVDGRSLPPKPV